MRKTFARLARGTTAAAVLVAVLVVVPFLLAVLVGWPLPGGVPSGSDVVAALQQPVSWVGVVKVLACVAWLAWLQFAACVLVEAWAQLSRKRVPAVRLPLSGPVQGVARKLVVAVMLAFVTGGIMPAVANAQPVPVAVSAGPVAGSLAESGIESSPSVVPERPAAGPESAPATGLVAGLVGPAHGSVAASVVAASVEAQRPVDESSLRRYIVQDGDNLWDIAADHLGDGMRYIEIYRLNVGLEQADGDQMRDPGSIRPSWALRMPEDATGLPAWKTPAGPAPEVADVARAGAGLAGSGGVGGAADADEVAPVPADPGDAADVAPVPADPGDAADQESVSPLPVLFAGIGSGLAATCLLVALDRLRRRQQRLRRGGHRISLPSPDAVPVERALRTHEDPERVAFLDLGLRVLAGGLADRDGSSLPDVVTARLTASTLELRLLRAAGEAPPPFSGPDDSTTWKVQLDDLLELAGSSDDGDSTTQPRAPLPALVSMAGQGGQCELIDLERLGSLAVGGDRNRVLDLLRYIGVELAHSVWSDQLQVTLVGFGEELVALNPERLNYASTLGPILPQLETKLDTTAAALATFGSGDALAARVANRTEDPWIPHVVLVAAEPEPDEAERRAELFQRLRTTGRCGLGIVVAGAAPEAAWQAHLGDDGMLTVAALRLRGRAYGVPSGVAPGLVALVDTARSAIDEPPPARDEPVPWWEQALDDADVDAAAEPIELVGRTSRRHAGPAERRNRAADLGRASDPDIQLDADLEAWRGAPPTRPTVGVLGPVKVFGLGTMPRSQFAWYAEAATFLALHPRRRVGVEELTHALWGDQPAEPVSRRETIATVRRWLGTDPAGEPFLRNLAEDRSYPLDQRVLLDWSLFTRLCERARRCDPRERILDLQAALELVRGRPFDGIEPGRYAWLAESGAVHVMESAIIDAAHALADAALDVHDTALARWAARRGQLADELHSSDLPYGDLMRAAHADDDWDEVVETVRELLAIRAAEIEDLNPETLQLIDRLVPGAQLRTLYEPPEARTA